MIKSCQRNLTSQVWCSMHKNLLKYDIFIDQKLKLQRFLVAVGTERIFIRKKDDLRFFMHLDFEIAKSSRKPYFLEYNQWSEARQSKTPSRFGFNRINVQIGSATILACSTKVHRIWNRKDKFCHFMFISGLQNVETLTDSVSVITSPEFQVEDVRLFSKT